MSRIELLGLPVDALAMEATLHRIETFVESGTAHQHVVVNAAKVVQAQDDPELARVIRECDLISVDGMAVVWAGRLLGRPVPERVAGIDLMDNLLARAAQLGWRVYFLGARQDVVEDLVRREQRAHPGLVVAGFRNGYWQAHEEQSVVEAVTATRPDILLVAMSSPRKEQFLGAHKAQLAVPFAMGVGGSFDVVAGRVTRAPLWMQRIGLEWLHRLAQEPRRMAKRYVVGNTRFIILVVSHWRAAR